jgi:hypothetical protein
MGLALNTTERLQVRQNLALLTNMSSLISELDTEFVRVSQQAPWAEAVPYILQWPGFQVHNALVLLAAIGEITRFPTAKQLVGYRGLGASVHRSGQVAYTGRITKQGRREMRHVLVEAAWTAVGGHPYWKAQFARLRGRLGENKAIVAIARKLLVAIWHVLSHREADRHHEPTLVARKLLRRAWALKATGRGGQSAGAWVRAERARLGIGAELTGIAIGKVVHRLPPPVAEAGRAEMPGP